MRVTSRRLVAAGRVARSSGHRLAFVSLVAVGLATAGLAATGVIAMPWTTAASTDPASGALNAAASANADAPDPELQARADAAERADRAKRPTPTTSPSSAPPSAAAWVSPMPGARVTSCYGMRWGVLHAGVDLAISPGTPIHAAGAGTVVSAGWSYAGYGISVMIDHGNGYLTHYAHQSRVIVQAGQHVSAGQIIGYEGATGDVTGPHLHFEVHQGLWHQIDPAPWLRAHGVPISC